MRHIRELMALAADAYPNDQFFVGVRENLINFPEVRPSYLAYERAMTTLDPASWTELKLKAIAHFKDHRKGQLKQGFFNQLNDAFAYQHLKKRGYRDVKILREVGKTQPDIEYNDRTQNCYCEVKTLSISDDIIVRRQNCQGSLEHDYTALSEGFLNKLRKALDVADGQIKARGKVGLIYVVVHFDDITLAYYDAYRRQIAKCLNSHTAPNIFVKVGLLGRRHIRKGQYAAASIT